jgi:hypothetical protein
MRRLKENNLTDQILKISDSSLEEERKSIISGPFQPLNFAENSKIAAKKAIFPRKFSGFSRKTTGFE